MLSSNEVFNPESSQSREKLAELILSTLDEMGFHKVNSAGELQFELSIGSHAFVRIYTTIIQHGSSYRVRGVGKDAIRIVGLYKKDNFYKPLIKEARTYRTGTLSSIVKRTSDKINSVKDSLLKRPTCRSCGSITFVSKSGNDVCSQICWVK